MADTTIDKKRLLVVFEGEGTLWCKVKGKDRAADGVYRTRTKSTVQLRPGLLAVLHRMLDLHIDVGLWCSDTLIKIDPWLETILGEEICEKLRFRWFQNKTFQYGGGIRVKESAQIAAAFPEFGYSHVLFVDHNFYSHAMSLPGNLLLVREFKGDLPDVFMECWVWEQVKVLLNWLDRPEHTVPEFLLNTKRPRAQGIVAESFAGKSKAMTMALACRAVVDIHMDTDCPGAKAARIAQEAWLDKQVPGWKHELTQPNPAAIAELDPIVSGGIEVYFFELNVS
jgi:hypothetical protein